jgi:hypothetical protein
MKARAQAIGAEAAPSELPFITYEQCARIASGMRPKPSPTPEEFKDWFDNTAALIARWKTVDGSDHIEIREAWDRIEANMRESQTLLGAFGDLRNVAPPEMRQLDFVRQFLNSHQQLVDGLHSIEKWAGKYREFLDRQAREHLGAREPSKQWSYVAIVQYWVSRGGKPSISAYGPLARFLIDVSELLFGEGPAAGTVPGIVQRAKDELGIV